MKRLYKFDGGEFEWIAAPDKKTAIKWYKEQVGFTDEDMYEVEVTNVHRKEWAEMTLTNTDYDKNDKDDWKTMSFEEYIEKEVEDNECAWVASTDW